MDLIGKWQVVEVMQFDEEKGMIWTKVSDLLAREDADEEAQMFAKTIFLFEEDGSLTMLSPLPEDVSQEEIDEAVAAGEITLRDGQMVTGENHWKVECDKLFADTGAEGEVLGEAVGPWEEIKQVDDHTIENMMFRLQKVE